MKCTKRLAHLLVILTFALSLSGCGTAGGVKNLGMGLTRSVINVPRALWRTAARTGSGVGNAFWSGGRSAMGMGPRVLSVPSQ